ncbi:MAG: hypothetical protein GX946_04530 [Oligosphaeraceae bacterium]|nr:hypothetical protein [Oligosphaeraceae bacterium]
MKKLLMTLSAAALLFAFVGCKEKSASEKLSDSMKDASKKVEKAAKGAEKDADKAMKDAEKALD